MADKTIGSLPQAQSVDDSSLFVCEQQGTAMKTTGAQWKGFAVQAVSQYVEPAQQAAQQAQQAAQQAKNLRIASTIIETISGAVSAYMGAIKAYAEIPGLGPVMGAIQAATVVAAGMAEVEKIRNTDVDKDSAPSASSSGMSAAVSAPVLPEEMPQTRILTSAEDEDRLNRMAYDQRVYVVYSDIAQAGRRVQVRDSEATF